MCELARCTLPLYPAPSAPAGWGWSGRFVTSVLSGCIPVIVQDGIKVEWEDQLPLKDFALRVPFMYLHRCVLRLGLPGAGFME